MLLNKIWRRQDNLESGADIIEHKQDFSSGPVIRAKDLVVIKQGKTILKVEDISVFPGEVLAIVGPNGAGKSTLLTILACLEFPTKGAVFFRGHRVTRKNVLSVRREMAVVFQEPLLLDGTVRENVRLGLSLRGMKEDAERRVDTWLERFGITHLSGQMAHTLSGGEAQRTALARALVLEPKVLFLDEPFASLDLMTKHGLLKEFRGILEDSGTTTVLVSHDFSEVRALATRVIVLSGGRIQAEGTPDEISLDVLPSLKEPVRPNLTGG
ncbi:MAG TPA: ATP-binding cassette domain-containing protein [Firmicutes bacterium]|nr:ATP-binding cassette domain-containing protein [Candidatus Fermentithermobacillaceae bacterium]